MSLIAELKRRNVFRVGVAYAIVAWLLVEVASVVLPTFKAPEWVMQVFTFLLILGFPVALIFAWAFEMTPEGIKRETAVDPDESITSYTGRKLDFAIIGLLAVAVVYFAVDKFVLEAEPEQASAVREKSIAVLPLANRERERSRRLLRRWDARRHPDARLQDSLAQGDLPHIGDGLPRHHEEYEDDRA